jgi:WhiB family redox-sensing transcriptional regulator
MPLPEILATEARCRDVDPEAFFPLPRDVVGQRMAKAVCDRCHVAAHCLAYALTEGVSGIWGGTTDWERDKMRARLRRVRA